MYLTHTSLLPLAAQLRLGTLLAATTQEQPSGTVAVLALCALAVVIGGAIVRVGRRRRATWFRAPAVVTELVTRSIGGGNHDVFPKFTFVNAHGQEVSVEQHSNRPRCQLG